jgi:hypothetical protein
MVTTPSGRGSVAPLSEPPEGAVLAILSALSRAVRRDLAGLQSVKVNNFFLFVALLIWGALVSGVKPASSYPFLLLLGFLLLFPLSSDPLGRIPPNRLASWPLSGGQRFALRMASLALSPVLWLTVLLMLKTSASLALIFLVLASAIQGSLVLGRRVVGRAPAWNPWRYIPLLPGPLGGIIRKDTRELLSVLDPYVAVLLSTSGSAYRLFRPEIDPAAFPMLALLVALALSTYAQSLFGLDSAAGATRYRLLPLRGWQILLAKDIAFLGVLFVLVLPLGPSPGMTFGLAALAIGHIPSVALRLPQQRWRFSSGRVAYGVAQGLAGFALGFGAWQAGVGFLLFTAAAWLLSLYFCGRSWDRA